MKNIFTVLLVSGLSSLSAIAANPVTQLSCSVTDVRGQNISSDLTVNLDVSVEGENTQVARFVVNGYDVLPGYGRIPQRDQIVALKAVAINESEVELELGDHLALDNDSLDKSYSRYSSSSSMIASIAELQDGVVIGYSSGWSEGRPKVLDITCRSL